jgi:hypothetical protein
VIGFNPEQKIRADQQPFEGRATPSVEVPLARPLA